MRKKKKEQHIPMSDAAAASSNDDYEMTFYKDKEQSEAAAVNIPPMIAFQKIKLFELKRRCNGIYRRHQGRRSRMINLEKNQEYMNISEQQQQQQQQHGMIDEEYFV
jgi:broad specificity polyphosphatase/5'/3'-nucleotidase SurE